jgi:hypothetical protein
VLCLEAPSDLKVYIITIKSRIVYRRWDGVTGRSRDLPSRGRFRCVLLSAI